MSARGTITSRTVNVSPSLCILRTKDEKVGVDDFCPSCSWNMNGREASVLDCFDLSVSTGLCVPSVVRSGCCTNRAVCDVYSQDLSCDGGSVPSRRRQYDT